MKDFADSLRFIYNSLEVPVLEAYAFGAASRGTVCQNSYGNSSALGWLINGCYLYGGGTDFHRCHATGLVNSNNATAAGNRPIK